MFQTDVTPAILSRDFDARLYRAIKSQHVTAASRCDLVALTNQTNMTDYDILGSSLVLVGCLAKRKRTINRRVHKRLDMEQFHHFGTVFMKKDGETGKVVQKPCLFTRQRRSAQLDGRSVCDFVAR